MDNNIYISGVIGDDVNDVDVIRQVKALGEIESLNVYITSAGGSIDVGFSIYNYLKGLKCHVNTFARGNCDSIATVIFQAGDKRHIEQNINSFVIHNAHITLLDTVDANELKNIESQLRKEEDRITKFYSSRTGLPFDALDKLMDRETNLKADEVKALGFADEIYSELKAIAKLRAKPTDETPTETPKNNNKIMSNLEQKITDLYNFVIGNKPVKDEAKNIFFLKLADGTEAYVDSKDGDFIGKRVTRVDNGNITDEPLNNGVHPLAVGGQIVVDNGYITELQTENTDGNNNDENNNTMNEEIKSFIAEKFEALKAELKEDIDAKLEAVGMKEDELQEEAKAQKTAINSEYNELKGMLRNIVTEFNVKGNERRIDNEKKGDDMLNVASVDNIRKVRELIKAKKSN